VTFGLRAPRIARGRNGGRGIGHHTQFSAKGTYDENNRMMMVACRFEPEQFERIKAFAMARRISYAAAVRVLSDKGLGVSND
jgi:hypothetical protein